jgi:hypothetical protein
MDPKKIPKKVQAILFGVFMLVFVGYMAGGKLLKGVSGSAPAEVAIQEVDDSQLKKINILFIGNDYVTANDMPKILESIALSDKAAQVKLNVKAVAKQGYSLLKHWNEGVPIDEINLQKWDFVVLQEHGLWVSSDKIIDSTHQAIANFNGEITKNGAKTIILMNWANKAGSKWYKDLKYAEKLRNPQYMQRLISTYTKELGQNLGATVIPVGDYWAYALNKNPTLVLHAPDGNNPSVAGSYFTALLFYRYFTGRTAEGVTYAPAGADPNSIKILKDIASQ